MTAVNPVEHVFVFFKYLVSALPSPIIYLIYLAGALFVVAAVVRMIFR